MDTPSLQHAPVDTLAGPIAQVHRNALLADSAEAVPPDGTDAATHARTIIHVFEPVRDEHESLVDFRLHFDGASAHHATRSFAGIRMKATGEWAAPGAAFYMLKQVYETGEPVRSATRHVGEGFELQCHQGAIRHGDTVVTTTTIITRHCQD